MPVVLWWLLGGLTVGGGTGFFLGVETGKAIRWLVIAAVIYWAYKAGVFK